MSKNRSIIIVFVSLMLACLVFSGCSKLSSSGMLVKIPETYVPNASAMRIAETEFATPESAELFLNNSIIINADAAEAMMLTAEKCNLGNGIVPKLDASCQAIHYLSKSLPKFAFSDSETARIYGRLLRHPSENVRIFVLIMVSAGIKNYGDHFMTKEALFKYITEQKSDNITLFALTNSIIRTYLDTPAGLSMIEQAKTSSNPALSALAIEYAMTAEQLASQIGDTEESYASLFKIPGAMTSKELEANFLLSNRCKLTDEMQWDGVCYSMTNIGEMTSRSQNYIENDDINQITDRLLKNENPLVRVMGYFAGIKIAKKGEEWAVAGASRETDPIFIYYFLRMCGRTATSEAMLEYVKKMQNFDNPYVKGEADSLAGSLEDGQVVDVETFKRLFAALSSCKIANGAVLPCDALTKYQGVELEDLDSYSEIMFANLNNESELIRSIAFGEAVALAYIDPNRPMSMKELLAKARADQSTFLQGTVFQNIGMLIKNDKEALKNQDFKEHVLSYKNHPDESLKMAATIFVQLFEMDNN